MKNPTDIKHFKIYNEKKIDENELSKNQFVEIIKKIIKQHKKVVVEGQLNIRLINEIAENKKSWMNNLKKRFEKDPANYGRIGWMEALDEADGKKGLNDYIKNGIDGIII